MTCKSKQNCAFSLFLISWTCSYFLRAKITIFDHIKKIYVSLSANYYIVKCSTGRSTLVGQRPVKSLDRPSLNFLKIGWLGFSNIEHDNSWLGSLGNNKAILLEKEITGGPNFAQRNWIRPKMSFFCHFPLFG